MKKRIVLLAAALIGGMLIFTSCGKEKDDEVKVSALVKSVEGSYNVNCAMDSSPSVPATVELKGVGGDKAKFTIGGIDALGVDNVSITIPLSGEIDAVNIDWTGTTTVFMGSAAGMLVGVSANGTIVKRGSQALAAAVKSVNRDAEQAMNIAIDITINEVNMSIAIDNEPAL